MVADVYIHNIDDFKDSNGNWVKSAYFNNREQSITRSYVLWKSVRYRTKEGGTWQNKHPTYLGSNNLFEDYQVFAEWCNKQYGYMKKDSTGAFWGLDKDILVPGNKDYSPDTCMFVPHNINKLFTASDSKRGPYPIGVTKKSKSAFGVAVSDGYKKRVYLGQYNDPFTAHQAWQRGKIGVISDICELDYISEHTLLKNALIQQAGRIQDDLLNKRETV